MEIVVDLFSLCSVFFRDNTYTLINWWSQSENLVEQLFLCRMNLYCLKAKKKKNVSILQKDIQKYAVKLGFYIFKQILISVLFNLTYVKPNYKTRKKSKGTVYKKWKQIIMFIKNENIDYFFLLLFVYTPCEAANPLRHKGYWVWKI